MSRREHGEPQIEELNIGEATEPEGRGTGECSRTDDLSDNSAVRSEEKQSMTQASQLMFHHLSIRWQQSSTRDQRFLMSFIEEKTNKQKDVFHIISSMTFEA